jgi:hypothetical protein
MPLPGKRRTTRLPLGQISGSWQPPDKGEMQPNQKRHSPPENIFNAEILYKKKARQENPAGQKQTLSLIVS